MRIERRHTTAGQSPYAAIPFRSAVSEIRNPDGSVVFRLDGIEVPEAWSQVASDVLAQKYFRKAGVPAVLKKVEENDVPSFLWRSIPDEAALAKLPEAERYGSEISSKQVFDRLAGCWTYWGWKGGYFSSEEDAHAFHDELRFMLASQMVAPNSPQWFNTGLHWAYGIDGPSQGHFYVDFKTGKLVKSKSSYEHPQPHACFIQGVQDDLVNEGGIMDLWVREARLFKYGSGTGSNFSRLRGENEKLSGGGKSSGLMSFLKIGDRAAGAIKSGGTTRRAAKMVICDIDHPDIEQFIDWKVKEEQKVAALVAGSKLAQKHLNAIMAACQFGSGDARFDAKKNAQLRTSVACCAAQCALVRSRSASSPSRGASAMPALTAGRYSAPRQTIGCETAARRLWATSASCSGDPRLRSSIASSPSAIRHTASISWRQTTLPPAPTRTSSSCMPLPTSVTSALTNGAPCTCSRPHQAGMTMRKPAASLSAVFSRVGATAKLKWRSHSAAASHQARPAPITAHQAVPPRSISTARRTRSWWWIASRCG